MNSLRCVLCLSLLPALGAQVQTEEWAAFRGPNGAGGGPGSDIPTRWEKQDYSWKVSLPGVGHSSPVVWGEKVFVTSAERQTGKACCCAWTATASCCGRASRRPAPTARTSATASPPRRRWPTVSASMPCGRRRSRCWWKPMGTTARSSGRRSLASSRASTAAACRRSASRTCSSSPTTRTAAARCSPWTPPAARSAGRCPAQVKNATYSTPCLYQPAGKPAELILTNWQLGVTATDPKTGKSIWSASVFDTGTQERAIASPVIAGDLILATSGFVTGKKEFVALRPGPDGVKEVWRLDRAVSYLPTPLVKGDRIFLCSEQGIASWLEAGTGKVIWQERLAGNFSASPVCTGDHIYCVANNGDVFVVQAGDEYRLLGKSRLGEPTQSTPAIAGGRIFFRTEKSLFALGGKKQ